MPDAGIVPSAQADGKVRQLAAGGYSSGVTDSLCSNSKWGIYIGCYGSGLAGSMGTSAMAIGSRRAVRSMPASYRRPRPTASLSEVRQLALPGYSLE